MARIMKEQKKIGNQKLSEKLGVASSNAQTKREPPLERGGVRKEGRMVGI